VRTGTLQRKRLRFAALSISCAAIVLGLAGCTQDMATQPRYNPLRASDFFGDRRSERPLVPGTVARGQLRIDDKLYTGMVNGQLIDSWPFETKVTREDLLRGQERFNINCAPCHDRTGYGNGLVAQRGFRHPPSYHIDRLRNAPLGHFFDVMTRGFGAMQDVSDRVTPEDRWRIAAYIRTLQYSQRANASDLPASDRGKLDQKPATPGKEEK
jgi:mono/diheme cytochrome c family protein